MPFVKRHKVLSALFLFSIFVMVKNSSIPYLFIPPTFIEFIFDAPQSCFFSNIAQMVDTFASAYVTSLMFYYMVDFLPAIKQEKKAKEILAPKLVNLYLYISELLAMIEYSAKQEHLLQTGDIADMDKLNFRSKDVLCKRKSFKNEEETGVAAHSYNLLKDCNKYMQAHRLRTHQRFQHLKRETHPAQIFSIRIQTVDKSAVTVKIGLPRQIMRRTMRHRMCSGGQPMNTKRG